MIPDYQAQAYIKQFALMKGYPRSSDQHFAEKIELLVDHFSRAAQDDHHGGRMVEWVHQNKRFCPETADIWEAARATAGGTPGNGDEVKRRECGRCAEGWETVLVHARWSQDRKPRAGFVEEIIADGIAPDVGDALLRDPMRFLNQIQFDRLEQLRAAWPASYHSRFETAVRRCRRCWGGKAA